MKKYTVYEAIWIAAARYAYEQFMKIKELTPANIVLSSSKLLEIALNYSDADIQFARIHQHCNGDHEKCSNRYLRKVKSASGENFFRVTALQEFEGDKEYPDSIDDADEIILEDGTVITIKELRNFIGSDYMTFVKTNINNKTSINYLGILDYLKNNSELPYKDPEKPGLTEEQRDMYRLIKKNGQDIVAELKKIHNLCSKNYALTKCEKISWDDGSHQKTRKYLWLQMKYEAYANRLESISLFAEMETSDKPVYRVSLELKNDKATIVDLNNYHRHLEVPIDNEIGLVYVSGSNELGRPDKLDEPQEVIKQKVNDREYDKVQISKYIETDHYSTNEEIEVAILEAIEALIPYYEYVIGADTVMEVRENMGFEKKKLEYDKNMILYGPPGTGKTYSTAKYAVAICDGDDAPDLGDYSSVMNRYRELMKEQRIAFVTFHQSYGYEEFIEGIKPVINKADDCDNDINIKYDVVDGVFKAFCDKARTSNVISKSYEGLVSDSATVWKVTVRPEIQKDCFDNGRVRIAWEFDSKGAVGLVDDIQKGDIIITTDGSRSIINGIAIVASEEAKDLHTEADSTSRDVVWISKDINENIKDINNNKILHRKTVARVPDMSVAAIISLAKKINPEDEALAETKIEENRKPYVFVIDEINRGNISKIFGELITLIEDTKREGLEECIPAILPYSGDKFSVPNNVYIIGTMNTADRSIALMDTALRRRFRFKEMLPEHELLNGVTVENDGETLDVGLMLKIINDRITYLYDREHMIGHAIFMSLKKNNSIENLAAIFSKSVIPLLQEYFYEDYEKIRLVLGDNAKKDINDMFIIAEDVPENIFEGYVSDEIDIPERSYRIEYQNFNNIKSYKMISKKL